MTAPTARTAPPALNTNPAPDYVSTPVVPAGSGKARYDKTDPYGGTFRAYLAQDWSDNLVGKVVGVGIDATGKLVVGKGQSGLVGVIVLTQAHRVTEGQVDVMRFGCIVGFQPTDYDTVKKTGTAAVAGTHYYVDPATGIVNATKGSGIYVGTTLGADRLEVNIQL